MSQSCSFLSKKRKFESIDDIWSDSRTDMEEFSISMRKRFRMAEENIDCGESSQTVPAKDSMHHHDKQLETVKHFARSLQHCLVRSQAEVKRLVCHWEMKSSLRKLISSLNDAESIVVDLVDHVPTEDAASHLKKQLQKTVTISNSLHIPSGMHNGSYKSAYRGLSRVRRLLDTGLRMANMVDSQFKTGSSPELKLTLTDNKSKQVEAGKDLVRLRVTSVTHWKPSLKVPFFLKPPTLIYKGMTSQQLNHLHNSLVVRQVPPTSSRKSKVITGLKKPQVFHNTCRDLKGALPPLSDKENHNKLSNHWKPSLKVPFFLKPPTLMYKPMTEDLAHSLTHKLANVQLMEHTIFKERSKKPTKGLFDFEVAYTWKDLQDVLKSLPSKETSCCNQDINQPHSSVKKEMAKSKSTHWKPSLNVPFYLKPATLVYKGMTAPQSKKLAVQCDPLKTKERSDKKPLKKVFEKACQELYDILTTDCSGGNKKEKQIDHAPGLILRFRRSKLRQNVLDDIVDVGVVRKGSVSMKKKVGGHSCTKNKSRSFKVPYNRPSGRAHCSPPTSSKREDKEVKIVGNQLATLGLTAHGDKKKDSTSQSEDKDSMVSYAAHKDADGECSTSTIPAVKQQSKKTITSCSSSSSRTILVPKRRLTKADHHNPQVVYESSEFFSEKIEHTSGLLIGAEVTLLNDGTQTEYVPRVKLGKRSPTDAQQPAKHSKLDH